MIVFITIPWFLPAYRAGGPVQSIANLVENFHEDTEYRIFCGHTDLNGEQLPGIETDQWVEFNAYTKVWYASKDISKTLTKETELIKPDLIFMIGIFSWHYNLVPLFFCKAPVKIVSVRGMLHAGALAQKSSKKKLFLQALKLTGIRKKIIFHATDEGEEKFIKAVFGDQAKVAVAKNFGRKMISSAPPEKLPGSLKLVTIALISPMKNHLTVLQALAKSKSQIEYNIYGPVKDQAYWQQCLEEMNLLPGNIMVRYHGETDPSSVDSLLAAHHVFIMPSESENFGHAIFESLSAGRPVITSDHTPWNGLPEANAGINTIIDTDRIAAAVDFFAGMSNEAYRSFSEGAIKYIRANTNNAAIAEQYKNLFNLKNHKETK